MLVTAPDHPTASVGALGLAALRADPFVCLPVGTGLRTVLHRHAAAAGFTPHVPFETTSLPRLRDLVAHGLGVALVARSVAEAPGPRVVVEQRRGDDTLGDLGGHRTERQVDAVVGEVVEQGPHTAGTQFELDVRCRAWNAASAPERSNGSRAWIAPIAHGR